MRIRIATMALAAALAATSAAIAQDPPVPAELRDAALENLLAERGGAKQLEKAIVAARQAGVTDQAILEARFLYHIDQLDDAAIAAMLPEFLRQQPRFRLADSAIFAVEEDWLAVVEYVKAIAALQNNDPQAFKNHIKEAFWLGPRQAAAFAPHIEHMRHDEAMRAITINFDTGINALDGGAPRTLASLIDGHKALLLHFWSPLSRECEASLPDFARTSTALAAHGIATVSLVSEPSPAAIAMLGPHAASCDFWAVDSTTTPLARLLRVQTLPTMTLVSPAGKILFSGDPHDEPFWNALRGIDPSITRPASDIDSD